MDWNKTTPIDVTLAVGLRRRIVTYHTDLVTAQSIIEQLETNETSPAEVGTEHPSLIFTELNAEVSVAFVYDREKDQYVWSEHDQHGPAENELHQVLTTPLEDASPVDVDEDLENDLYAQAYAIWSRINQN